MNAWQKISSNNGVALQKNTLFGLLIFFAHNEKKNRCANVLGLLWQTTYSVYVNVQITILFRVDFLFHVRLLPAPPTHSVALFVLILLTLSFALSFFSLPICRALSYLLALSISFFRFFSYVWIDCYIHKSRRIKFVYQLVLVIL